MNNSIIDCVQIEVVGVILVLNDSCCINDYIDDFGGRIKFFSAATAALAVGANIGQTSQTESFGQRLLVRLVLSNHTAERL